MGLTNLWRRSDVAESSGNGGTPLDDGKSDLALATALFDAVQAIVEEVLRRRDEAGAAAEEETDRKKQ
jgi:hypothetical protein